MTDYYYPGCTNCNSYDSYCCDNTCNSTDAKCNECDSCQGCVSGCDFCDGVDGICSFNQCGTYDCCDSGCDSYQNGCGAADDWEGNGPCENCNNCLICIIYDDSGCDYCNTDQVPNDEECDTSCITCDTNCYNCQSCLACDNNCYSCDSCQTCLSNCYSCDSGLILCQSTNTCYNLQTCPEGEICEQCNTTSYVEECTTGCQINCENNYIEPPCDTEGDPCDTEGDPCGTGQSPIPCSTEGGDSCTSNISCVIGNDSCSSGLICQFNNSGSEGEGIGGPAFETKSSDWMYVKENSNVSLRRFIPNTTISYVLAEDGSTPFIRTGTELPTSLPNGAIYIYNKKLYMGLNNSTKEIESLYFGTNDTPIVIQEIYMGNMANKPILVWEFT